MKKIVLSLFVVGLIFTGFSVNAMGGEVHLVGKDGVVNNQLKYTQTLRRGTRNANVLALQKKLQEFGFYHKKLDSDYGSGTIAAVKQFQRAKGLKDDGIAGPKTYAMILATDSMSTDTSAKPLQKWCTKEYKPVCATPMVAKDIPSTVIKTYSNSCMAKLDKAKVLYKGKCQTTKPIDVISIEWEPIVETNLVSNITDESAKLHGEVDLNGLDEVQSFFVYGQSLRKIQDVPNVYESYGEIVEQADSIKKIYAHDVEEGDDEDFQKEIGDLDEGEVYYYRACVEFENIHEDEELRCGGIKKFETNNEDSNEECLFVEIEDDFSNQLNVNDNHKLIGNYNIKNICNDDLRIDDINFKVASSYAIAQFEDISVEVEGDEVDGSEEVHSYYDASIDGKSLSFSAHPNFDGGYGLLEAGDDWIVEIYADIEGVDNFSQNSRTTSFAISLDNIEYDKFGGDDFEYEDDIWGQLMIVNYL